MAWCCRCEVARTLPVLLVLLGCCAQGLVRAECPRLCECKWRGGKESVACAGANLTAVPLALDAGTQLLDLSGNALVTVRADEFSKAGLLNLQKVYVARCRLRSLDRFAFRNLINLVELDLSFNALAAVPSHAFASVPELRELRLCGNPIQRVMNDAFAHVPQLIRLELSECRIGTLEARAFAGLEQSLEWLKLDGNQLAEVRGATLTALRGLHGLELAANPWNCSCALRPLREWMLRQNVPFHIPPVCHQPARLAAKPWDRLELDEFACRPQIQAPDATAHGVEGGNVTISCHIGGVPEPHVKWLVKNRVIANVTSVPVTIGKRTYLLRVKDNSSNLTIVTADVQDAGVYVCAAENKAGRAEASVTLAVSRRPHATPLADRAIMAGALGATLFVLGSCAAVLCVCAVRRRQRRLAMRWRAARRTNSGRRHQDNYEKIEMSCKAAPGADRGGGGGAGGGDAANGGNGVGPQRAGGDIAVVGSVRRNGDYRGVPNFDTDQELDEDEDVGYEDNTETPTPTNVGHARESKLWTAAAAARSTSSPNAGHWNSAICDSSLDPDDLHIPRRTKEETRDDCNKSRNSTFGTYKPRLLGDARVESLRSGGGGSGGGGGGLQQHVMHKQLLGEGGGSLYTTLLPGAEPSAEPAAEQRYPDLLAGNPADAAPLMSACEPSASESLYCTLPRKNNAYSRGSVRYRSCDSESPLLPRSRYGSSGGDSSATSAGSPRRFSDDACRSQPLPGLRSSSFLNLAPAPPSPPSATPLLNVSVLESRLQASADHALLQASSATLMSANSNTYDYHAAQLERFLEEYRTLQKQLSKMKETCDSLRPPDAASAGQLCGAHFLDPLLHNSLMLTPSPGSEDGNPKSILKKSLAPLTASASSPAGVLGLGATSPSTSADYGVDRAPAAWSARAYRRATDSGFYQN